MAEAIKGSGLSGFVQGFAGTLAPVILERKKEARDYFNKQVEYARTVGLQNRQKAKQQADATLSVARQLEAIGVPKEVIMAQINQDPNGLGGFYQGIDKLNVERASQGLPPLTSEEISGLVNVGGNFKAPDEDLATFVNRTYEPLSRAVRDPSFSANPENSLWASMMGYSAMDEARAELGNTVVAEGMTAEDLIAYGDAQPQKIGGQAVVTTNYAGLPADAEKPISPNEANTIRSTIQEMMETEKMLNVIQSAKDPQVVIDKIVDNLSRGFPSIERSYIEQEVEGYLSLRSDPTVFPLAASAATLSPEELEKAKAFVTDIVDNGDGTVTVTVDGVQRTDTVEAFRAIIAGLE